MDVCKAVVRSVTRKSPHGPYAIATPVDRPDIDGSVTFSLEPTVWDGGTWPEAGSEVLLGKLRKKRANGWRAKEGRFWQPSYEQGNNDMRITELPSRLEVHISSKARKAGITLPERQYTGDAGYDLRTIEQVVVEPGEVGKFPTGLNFNLPGHNDEGSLIQVPLLILPRTGLAAGNGLYPMAWVVDPGYRANDEDGLTLALRNLGRIALTFKPLDRVAQGLLMPVWTPLLVEIPASNIDKTARGAKRLGSSGIK